MIIRPGPSFLAPLFLRARKSGWRLEDFDSATPHEQLWVAEIDGHRAGFASVWENNNFPHNLFVDPNWQRHGVSSALLSHVQRTFTRTGKLKCLVQNEQAFHFYQQHS
jgi:GNAT superfamily N-acetyltransferase